MKTLFEGKKLYAVIIAFLLIITFFITSHIIRNHYQYVFKNVIIENASTANLLSSLMYEHQKAATSILESYARRPLFIDAAKKKDFNHVIFHMKSLCEHRTEIDAPFIADKSGTVWANYPVSKESYGKNLAYRDWYKGVSRDWRPYISTVFRLIVLEKNLAVAIAVPVFDKKGKVIGILGTTQRTPFLANLIRANIIDPKKSIALLDQEGNIIFSNTVPYEENITKYPDARVREKAVAGVFIDMECADTHKKGSISYVSIAPVKGVGWLVIVGQDKNAILKSLYGYFILSAVTGFVIFLFLAVSLLYFRREYKYRKTKELLQAEEKYRNIFNDAILGIYQTTPEGRILSANPALVKMYGYDTPEEVINNVTATQMYVNPEDREIFKGILSKEGVVEKFEVLFRKTPTSESGEIFWVSINAHVVKDGQGNITHYEGTIEDITSRKQAEEQIMASLREKEVLLKEIQHRVKNNLLTISGVLALQSERIKDSELKDAFTASMNRINAMTKIHTRLYQSEDFSRIGFKGYIEELVWELSRSYGFPLKNMITDIEDISLDINTAIPTGLIVNELVSNAMKHAFPLQKNRNGEPANRRTGEITITLKECDDENIADTPSRRYADTGHLILTVSDNGIGIPAHIDFRNTESVGLSLLVQLVEQINGSIELIRDNGTRFMITFSIDQEKTP